MTRVDWSTALGTEHAPPVAQRIELGAFVFDLQGPEAIRIRLAGREVVRRVGVRVRDREWDTVPPAVRAASGSDPRGTQQFEVQHAGGSAVDFSWSGRVEADGDAIVFEMDGRAAAAMEYNRIGLVVLHPPLVTSGRAFHANTNSGPITGDLPSLIGPQRRIDGVPQPLFAAFDRLHVEIDADLSLVFEFDGDWFEMEDQRNWSDGSFKTYSTPVALPVPRRLAAGERLLQRVRIEPVGEWPKAHMSRAATPRLRVGGDTVREMPAVGAAVDTDGHEPTSREFAALGELGLAHVRVDLEVGASAAVDLDRGRRIASTLGADIELAVTLSGSASEAATGLAGLAVDLRASWPLVTRVLVFHRSEAVTSDEWITLMKAACPDEHPVTWATGTRAHFAELNSSRPSLGQVGGIAFPITPQVHDSDEFSIATSLEAHSDIVATARSTAEGRTIHITPISLKPRFNAYASDGIGARVGADGFPTDIDPRQTSTFLAAWTVGSARRLAESGATSMTYFELTGARGLMEREDGSPWPDRILSSPGRRFPVFLVLAQLSRARGRRLVDVAVPEPFTAIGFRMDGERQVLLGNLSPRPVRLDVDAAGEIIRLERLASGGKTQALEPTQNVIDFGPYDTMFLSCRT